jgi:hypothetical protein
MRVWAALVYDGMGWDGMGWDGEVGGLIGSARFVRLVSSRLAGWLVSYRWRR